jgi:DNA-binding XRE family transcriptional regulator
MNKPKSVTRRIERTPEEVARIKALRDKYQRERPGPRDCGPTMPLGTYLALQQLLHTLKKDRERIGLSLSDLAERTGMDRAAISRLENGRQPNPTVATLSRYAAALGKSIAWSVAELPRKEAK